VLDLRRDGSTNARFLMNPISSLLFYRHFYWSIYLFIYISIYLSIYLYFHLYMSIHLLKSIYLFVYLCPSISCIYVSSPLCIYTFPCIRLPQPINSQDEPTP